MPTITKPTIGRVVWFRPCLSHPAQDQPMSAQVCYVHADGTVNLAIWDAHGKPANLQNVPLIQDGEAPPLTEKGAAKHDYCEWMPYQKAVASGAIPATMHARAETPQPDLAPNYQDRVRQEKADLDRKLEALVRFLTGQTETFLALPRNEMSRLFEQRMHMMAYSKVLADRIAEFR